MIKLVAFDFDGTLVDSKTVIKKEVEKNGFTLPDKFEERMGIKRLVEDLKSMGLREPEIIRKNINDNILKNIDNVKPAPGLKELSEIKEKKIILSNNLEKTIRGFLKRHRVKLFEEVYGAESGKTKIEIFKI